MPPLYIKFISFLTKDKRKDRGKDGLLIADDDFKPKSPGMKYKHYSPGCQTALYSFDRRLDALDEYRRRRAAGQRACIMCDCRTAADMEDAEILDLGSDERQIACNLYDKLREGEKLFDVIIAVAPEKQDGVMVGVMNRLTKACG